jgi:hypothetical protein
VRLIDYSVSGTGPEEVERIFEDSVSHFSITPKEEDWRLLAV